MAPLTYFIRHGETAWNAEYRLQGQADTDMTALGRTQASRNGRMLATLIDKPQDFDFVASPLSRTRETMELIRVAMRVPPGGYRIDPRLVELNFGDWQGRTFAELEAKEPGSTAARFADKWSFLPPGTGAESYEMLARRVRPWFEALERPTVCVTHGGVIRTIFNIVERIPERQVADLEIVQDRVLRLRDSRLEWL